MIDYLGKIVVSLSGNDKNSAFVVIKHEGRYVCYADGKKRKTDTPKKKSIKHIKEVAESGLSDISKATNGTIRKTLACFRKENAETDCSDMIVKEE